ncbi:NADH dehydrogenase [ubiquinone] 1 alpha subcomplex subunit 7-like [Anabrus simplex]|uniref:NADH dehydrogenase [ubiquinone] 1 alpha subcomplex subunit 7-like n=1 Tax=Anabrus simplex TaxID=316456 RepID=UPI0034DCD9E2
MAGKKAVEHRNVSPLLQYLRNFLLGRKHIRNHRFPDQVSPRTQPQPQLPDGPSHKLAGNYYYKRDPRREVPRSTVLFDSQDTKRIESEEEVTCPEEVEEDECTCPKDIPKPGNVWKWD